MCGAPAWALAPVRELGFLNLHTGERLKVPYWENGQYLPDALVEIRHVLRDHRANAEHAPEPPIDPEGQVVALGARHDVRSVLKGHAIQVVRAPGRLPLGQPEATVVLAVQAVVPEREGVVEHALEHRPDDGNQREGHMNP